MAEQASKIIQDEFKKIDAKLKCPICQSLLKEAKLLPCFHIFCKSPCLERLVVHGAEGQSLTCPTCQHHVTLPDNGVAALSKDFQVERLMEIRDSLENVKQTNCQNSNCGNKDSTASKFCQQCKRRLCEKCTEMHQMWGDFKHHNLVGMEEMKANAVDMLAPVKKTPKCPQHSKMDAKIYCETCSELICSDCTIYHHGDHNYGRARDVHLKHRQEITIALKHCQLKEKIETVQQSLAAFESVLKKINEQRVKAEAEIHAEINHLHEVLDLRRVELLNSLDKQYQRVQNDLAEQRDSVEKKQAKMSRCLEYAETGLETGSEGEVLRMKRPVLKQIEGIAAEFDPDILQPKKNMVIQFIKDNKAWQVCQNIGQVSSSAEDFEEEPYETLDNIRVHLDSGANLRQSTKSLVLTPPHSPADTQSPRSSSSSIKIAILRGFNGPFSAASNSKGQLVVSELAANHIVVLSHRDEKVFKFGKRGSKHGQFKSPYGVAIDHNDNIFVVDNENHRIQKFTPQKRGKFIAAVGSHGNQPMKFDHPLGICFNNMNHLLYVCDQGNNRIQVFTTDLEVKKSFGIQGNGIGEFQHPKFGAFSSANNFYVTDWGNHRVQVFTAEGEFVLAFSDKANGEQLKNPYGIAIDSSDRVYVSEHGQKYISMFTAQGEFISTFKMRAQTENNLFSLSVDQNDSIIAS